MIRWLVFLLTIGLTNSTYAQDIEFLSCVPTQFQNRNVYLKLNSVLRTQHPISLTLGFPANTSRSVHLDGKESVGHLVKELTLVGNARLYRMNTILRGKYVSYCRKENSIALKDRVSLLYNGMLIAGKKFKYDVQRHAGEITHTSFWFGSYSGVALAEHISIISHTQMILKGTLYSGCFCEFPSWHMKASSIELNFEKNKGTAHNNILYLKGKPIFASPYLSFPLKKQRKSGFLIPTCSTSGHTGLNVVLPYYLNLSTSHDMTLTLEYLNKHKIKFGSELRYLRKDFFGTVTSNHTGNLGRILTNSAGWIHRSRHQQVLSESTYINWDIGSIFGKSSSHTTSTTNINLFAKKLSPHHAKVSWSNNYWKLETDMHKYQVQQDSREPMVSPHSALPKISLASNQLHYGGFNTEWKAMSFRLNRAETFGWYHSSKGNHAAFYGAISYPITRTKWRIIPKIGIYFSKYSVHWGSLPGAIGEAAKQKNMGTVSSIKVHTLSECQKTVFSKNYKRSLERYLQYSYTPHENGFKLPDHNIFAAGYHYVFNVHQLHIGIIEHLYDAHINPQHISLVTGLSVYFPEKSTTSSFVIAKKSSFLNPSICISITPLDMLNAKLAVQFGPNKNDWSSISISGHWLPKEFTLIDFYYHHQRAPQSKKGYQSYGKNQVGFSFQWPFTQCWKALGRLDYSNYSQEGWPTTINKYTHLAQAILGLEYENSPCWKSKFTLYKNIFSSTKSDVGISLQLELGDLGRLETNSITQIYKKISNYYL